MPAATPIKKVRFGDTIQRRCRNGDNWCLTWAGDDHQYTSCDDGYGWDYTENIQYNTRVWRIRGDADNFLAEYLPEYPLYAGLGGHWYGYGILSVNGTLFHFLSYTTSGTQGHPFCGARLLYSADNGQTWRRHDGARAREQPEAEVPPAMFFWEETGAHAFSHIEFLQCGRDYGLREDEFVYLYAPNGGSSPHELNLARVPCDAVRQRDAYQFFSGLDARGHARWSGDISARTAIHTFPSGYSWYSWLPSVVYNAPLECYVMVASGTRTATDSMAMISPGTLGLYCAAAPWGPWSEVLFLESWTGDDPANRLYQPKLSPKWISGDGREMVLIYSDASDSWGRNYRWNQQRIFLEG